MHPRLAELTRYAEAQRAGLLEAVAGVAITLRDRRPADGRWSVAEVLEHLHRVERGIARLFEHAVGQARAGGVGPETETSSLLDGLDRFDLLEPARRMVAPDRVAPRGELDAAAALAALADSRRALLAAVEAGDGLALGQVTVPHPILGPLSLYEWLLFLAQHEARHARQIREIGRVLAACEPDPSAAGPAPPV